MSFKPEYFGLKRDCLYEIIATTYSITDNEKAIHPNASCMGIRLIDNNNLQIIPFYTTSTYKNLKANNIIAINFIDDIYLYALAALKDPHSSIGLIEFPSKYYSYKYFDFLVSDIPYIKKAWGLLLGRVLQEFQKTKKDELGDINVPVFKLDVIFNKKFHESYKLFNRAENLTLETIILATRLKIAKKQKNQYLFSKLYEKMRDHIENIERFGKNKKVLKTIELVSSYMKKLME
ncbi:MAG: DUF447 domain-containing protein [Promethearchaeota archaeon]